MGVLGTAFGSGITVMTYDSPGFSHVHYGLGWVWHSWVCIRICISLIDITSVFKRDERIDATALVPLTSISLLTFLCLILPPMHNQLGQC